MTDSRTPLLVTNGEAAQHVLANADIPAEIITWDDVLHEGPVPQTDDDASLRAIRSAFIASRGWQDKASALTRFEKRDRQLLSAAADREVVLWFEHDLYDQLQFWQVVSMLPDVANVTAIVTDDFVTHHDASELQALWPQRQSLSLSVRQNVVRLWQAFREKDPSTLHGLRDLDVPFAKATIDRWTGLFPEKDSGLDRIEAFVLKRLKAGPLAFAVLFRDAQAMEEAAFLGDSSFMALLNDLGVGDDALLMVDGEDDPRSAQVALTSRGLAHLSSKIGGCLPVRERWVGGVHLRPGNWWLWDPVSQTFCL